MRPPPGRRPEEHEGRLPESDSGYVLATIVRDLRWADEEHPDAKLDGHVIRWPGFGTINWSPDGQYVAYTLQNQNFDFDLYLYNAAAGGPPVPVATDVYSALPVTFSLDSSQVMYARRGEGTVEGTQNAAPLNTSTHATPYRSRARQHVPTMSASRAGLLNRFDAVTTGHPRETRRRLSSSHMHSFSADDERKFPMTSAPV